MSNLMYYYFFYKNLIISVLIVFLNSISLGAN
jgi:hypothetical protein